MNKKKHKKSDGTHQIDLSMETAIPHQFTKHTTT